VRPIQCLAGGHAEPKTQALDGGYDGIVALGPAAGLGVHTVRRVPGHMAAASARNVRAKRRSSG